MTWARAGVWAPRLVLLLLGLHHCHQAACDVVTVSSAEALVQVVQQGFVEGSGNWTVKLAANISLSAAVNFSMATTWPHAGARTLTLEPAEPGMRIILDTGQRGFLTPTFQDPQLRLVLRNLTLSNLWCELGLGAWAAIWMEGRARACTQRLQATRPFLAGQQRDTHTQLTSHGSIGIGPQPLGSAASQWAGGAFWHRRAHCAVGGLCMHAACMRVQQQAAFAGSPPACMCQQEHGVRVAPCMQDRVVAGYFRGPVS